MSAAWLAAAWVIVGAVAGLGPRRLRRATALTAPVLLIALSLLTAQGGPRPDQLGGGAVALPREAAGLLSAAGAALWLCLLLAEELDGRELVGIGTVGGAAVLLLSAGTPLLFGVAALLGAAALTLRWVTAAPSRATLAAGRIAGTGAAALVAAGVLLPAVSPDSQPGVVGGLLVVGVIAITALVPLGGWAAGALVDLRPPEIAVWLLVLAPAVLVSAFSIPGALPLLASLAFEHTLLACGLISAMWGGVMSLRSGQSTRYGRVALADLGLVAAGAGTGEPVAIGGGLVLILTHLVAAPLLLQRPRPGLGSPRRLVWLALCGLPPSPAFWGRFLVLQACVAFSGAVGAACVVAGGLVTVAVVITVARGEPGAGLPAPHHRVAAGWVLAAVALVVGLLPTAAIHLVFGPTA
ncbi:MAG: hypothetical protein ABSC16_08330 [Candidatus Dormibacteria bacterium]|jgi:hypothetical protein|nr:hypothetical protein [Chloroflexota bacterium]